MGSSVGTAYASGDVDPKYRLDNSLPLVLDKSTKDEEQNISVINYQEMPPKKGPYILEDYPVTPSGVSPPSPTLKKVKAENVYKQ